MDNRSSDTRYLSHRVEELERERDELRKDIEQLCLHQAGPSFLGVATRMHLRRTAGLEQEIDNFKKKLAACIRDNQNLQEELSEAYRIKSQLADLYSAGATKNMELENQVKFFQGCIADAFAERDHALMEAEKSKEHEEAISKEIINSKKRFEELESAWGDLWKENTALQTELLNLKEKVHPSEKVISKFYEIRQKATGCYGHENWDDICSCLLIDPADMWVFDEDRKNSTSKYIASLEDELGKMKNMMNNLQVNMRMGLEIEEHLKRKVQDLEKKLIASVEIFQNGLSALRDFYNHQRFEVMSILDGENDQIESMVVEIQDMMRQINTRAGLDLSYAQREQICDTECRDLHITTDTDSNAVAKVIPLASASVVADETTDTSDVLALALKEKVAALLLLSQQEERHMLERDLNVALQKKTEELQRNLFQVAHEKVKALMELAELKKQFQLQKENCICGIKHDNVLADGGSKAISSQLQDGKLKDFFKRTYLRRWIGKDITEDESVTNLSTDGSVPINKIENFPLDIARLKVENATLQESMASIEHLTSSIHKLHLSLLKVRSSTSLSGSIVGTMEALDNVIVEANRVKMALGGSLPVSRLAEASDAGGYSVDLDKPVKKFEVSQREKLDPVSTAGFEMVELLILAAELQKEKTVTGNSSPGYDMRQS